MDRTPTAIPISNKAGWRVEEWKRDVGISRSRVYELMAEGAIASVKIGAARVITTPPKEFLAGLEAA